MGVSDISGERGLRELLASCEVTGRKGFPDELMPVEIGSQRISRDRVAHCAGCGRSADQDALSRCELCDQVYCPAEARAEMCLVCARALARGSGRELTAEEIGAAQALQPWVRRGWVAEGHENMHVLLQAGRLHLRREPWLVVVRRRGKLGEQVKFDAPVGTRRLIGALLHSARALTDGTSR